MNRVESETCDFIRLDKVHTTIDIDSLINRGQLLAYQLAMCSEIINLTHLISIRLHIESMEGGTHHLGRLRQHYRFRVHGGILHIWAVGTLVL